MKKKELNKWRHKEEFIKKMQCCHDVSSSKLMYRFNAILIKITASYLVYIGKLILKFIWTVKRPKIANTIVKEKNKLEGLILSAFKTYYKSIIKALWYW